MRTVPAGAASTAFSRSVAASISASTRSAVSEEDAPRVRQRGAAGGALEQPRPDGGLQRLHPARQRRLADAEPPGRGQHLPLARYGEEMLGVVPVHGSALAPVIASAYNGAPDLAIYIQNCSSQ